jgi:hypothetical protein
MSCHKGVSALGHPLLDITEDSLLSHAVWDIYFQSTLSGIDIMV